MSPKMTRMIGIIGGTPTPFGGRCNAVRSRAHVGAFPAPWRGMHFTAWTARMWTDCAGWTGHARGRPGCLMACDLVGESPRRACEAGPLCPGARSHRRVTGFTFRSTCDSGQAPPRSRCPRVASIRSQPHSTSGGAFKRRGVLCPCAHLKITMHSAAYTRYMICNLDTHFDPLRVASVRPQTSSDLKSPALFLLPLRGALLLQRLGRLLLRFLLPVHTLAHGSPPRDGERGDLKPTGQPWRLRLQIAMPELYLRGAGCGTGMASAGNVGCGNRRASRRYSQAGDAAAHAAAFRLKRWNNQFGRWQS